MNSNHPSKNLQYYLEVISHLKRCTMERQKAPHKPVLLMAIGQLIEDGVISANPIRMNDVLRREFEEVWHRYCGDAVVFKPSIKNPFERLQTDGIWRYDRATGNAHMDQELIDLFADPTSCSILMEALKEEVQLGLRPPKAIAPSKPFLLDLSVC